MQSLLDFTPKLWITVWEENVPGFVDRFEEAREADRARLRLVVPGPLLPADVSLLQALQGGRKMGRLTSRERDAMDRVLWARWWTFEDAVLDTLRCSDFLALAGALRAWCEEVAFIEAVGSSLGEVGDRLEAAIDTLISRGIDDEPVEVDLGEAGMWSQALVARLNAYVHPNALGHDHVLHPERGRFFLVALDVLTAISRRCLALGLPTAESDRSLSVDDTPLLLAEQTRRLPALLDLIDEARTRRGQAALDERLRSEVVSRSGAFESPRDDLALDETSDPVVLVAGAPPEWRSLSEWHPELGFPQEPTARRIFSLAVAAWDGLEPALQKWQASGTTAQGTAFRLAYLSVLSQAAVLVLGVKRDLFLQSLTRSLLRGNPLATGLAARGLLEHHAAVVRAGQAVRSTLRALRQAVDGSAGQEDVLREQEEALLRLLVGAPGGEPVLGQVAQRAAALRADRPLGLGPTVEQSFGRTNEALVHGIWKRLSELVHGRTGALNPRGWRFNLGVTQIGLVVLTRMAEFERDLDVLAVFAEVIPVLESARRAVLSGGSIQADVRARAVPPYLVRGRDYAGSGTQLDPYRLLVGHSNEAYWPLLNTLGVTERSRESTIQKPFGVVDRVTHDGGTLYIVPAPH